MVKYFEVNIRKLIRSFHKKRLSLCVHSMNLNLLPIVSSFCRIYKSLQHSKTPNTFMSYKLSSLKLFFLFKKKQRTKKAKNKITKLVKANNWYNK